MPKYRNVKVKKKGGGYRIQRAKVLASGKLRFVKNKQRSTAKSTKRKGHSPARRKKGAKRRSGTMGRRRRYARKTQNFLSKAGGITGLAGLAGAAASMGAFDAVEQAMAGNYRAAGETMGNNAQDPVKIATAVMAASMPHIIKGVLRKFGVRVPAYV